MSDPLENISYEDLRRSLENLPVTWYPDLIRATVVAAIKKKVFREGAIAPFVERIEKHAKAQS